MTTTEATRHLFVVRVWREADGDSAGPWRGSVDHSASGQRVYFTDLADLADFIALRLGEGGMPKGIPRSSRLV